MGCCDNFFPEGGFAVRSSEQGQGALIPTRERAGDRQESGSYRPESD